MKSIPALFVTILGVATLIGGFVLTFNNHDFTGVVAILLGLGVAVGGTVALE